MKKFLLFCFLFIFVQVLSIKISSKSKGSGYNREVGEYGFKSNYLYGKGRIYGRRGYVKAGCTKGRYARRYKGCYGGYGHFCRRNKAGKYYKKILIIKGRKYHRKGCGHRGFYKGKYNARHCGYKGYGGHCKY